MSTHGKDAREMWRSRNPRHNTVPTLPVAPVISIRQLELFIDQPDSHHIQWHYISKAADQAVPVRLSHYIWIDRNSARGMRPHHHYVKKRLKKAGSTALKLSFLFQLNCPNLSRNCQASSAPLTSRFGIIGSDKDRRADNPLADRIFVQEGVF